MKQEATNQPNDLLGNISFQQKSTGLSLIITSNAAIYYLVNMWPMRSIALGSDAIPTGFGNLVLSTIILFILAQIVLQIVLSVGSGSTQTATAHEKAATLKATRNAYSVLTVSMFAIIGSIFFGELPLFYAANVAILGFALAEIVKFASQLVYARR